MSRFTYWSITLLTLTFAGITAGLVSGCSQATQTPAPPSSGAPQEDFISASLLKHCRFQNPTPTYAFKSTIPPNPIICDEGVARSVTPLSTAQLPSGIQFTASQLSLTGTANEKVTAAPYKFYIENEAGYQILDLKVTIK